MNRIQKMACWIVIWISAGVILATIAISVLQFVIGMPWSKAQGGLGFLGIAGLGGLAPLIFNKDKGKVTCDERDILIQKRAGIAGFALAYIFVGLACMIPFYIMGGQALIRVRWLPQIFIGACITHFFFYSITILFEYGFGSKNHE